MAQPALRSLSIDQYLPSSKEMMLVVWSYFDSAMRAPKGIALGDRLLNRSDSPEERLRQRRRIWWLTSWILNLLDRCFIAARHRWRWNVFSYGRRRLIGQALAGNPPPDIADELRDLLLDAVYSQKQAI
jgi:hypothetical protein